MKRVHLGIVFGLALACANAQTIGERKENQQDRIGEGVEKGSLTPRETTRLERKEARINKKIRRERRQNSGNLTNKEKKQIRRQQNRESRAIYRAKHNGKTQ